MRGLDLTVEFAVIVGNGTTIEATKARLAQPKSPARAAVRAREAAPRANSLTR